MRLLQSRQAERSLAIVLQTHSENYLYRNLCDSTTVESHAYTQSVFMHAPQCSDTDSYYVALLEQMVCSCIVIIMGSCLLYKGTQISLHLPWREEIFEITCISLTDDHGVLMVLSIDYDSGHRPSCFFDNLVYGLSRLPFSASPPLPKDHEIFVCYLCVHARVVFVEILAATKFKMISKTKESKMNYLE